MNRRSGVDVTEKAVAVVFKTTLLTVAGGSRRKDKNERGQSQENREREERQEYVNTV
jgi:hypothetical protein